MKSSEELKLKAAADIWRRTKINFTLKRNWKLKEIPEANFRLVQTGPWRKPSDIKTVSWQRSGTTQMRTADLLQWGAVNQKSYFTSTALFSVSVRLWKEFQSLFWNTIRNSKAINSLPNKRVLPGDLTNRKKMSFFFPLCSQKLQKYKTQFLAKHFQSSLFICPL